MTRHYVFFQLTIAPDTPFIDPFAEESFTESAAKELVSLELPTTLCFFLVLPRLAPPACGDLLKQVNYNFQQNVT
ncbi:hypothetical protein LC612_05235 [Nostoc sp. CHAB 5834]|nr:hypothetical protein [Nostoc sp. CHAB 5834]